MRIFYYLQIDLLIIVLIFLINFYLKIIPDDIEEVKEPIERQLNFEDESFVENVEEKNQSMETTSSASQSIQLLSANSSKRSKVVTMMTSPMISISPLSLEDKKPESSINKNKSTKTKKQISFKEVDREVPSRSLRTKKLSAPLTPRPKRGSQEVRYYFI